MTDSKNSKKKSVSGIGRIHARPSGAVSIYVDQEVGKRMTLPLNERVKTTWDCEKEVLIISGWGSKEES